MVGVDARSILPAAWPLWTAAARARGETVLGVPPQPVDHVGRVTVRGKDWIPDVLDPPVADVQRQASKQDEALGFECRQTERTRQREIRVAQQRVWQLEPARGLLLVGGVLGRQPEDPNTQLLELCVTIPVAAGLWRTAPGAGNRIPRGEATRRILSWSASSGVGEQDRPRRADVVESNRGSVRRVERDRREGHPDEMVRCSVVDRHRQTFGQVQELVRTHAAIVARWLSVAHSGG